MGASTVATKEITSETVSKITGFLRSVGVGAVIPSKHDGEGVFSDLIGSLLRVQHIHRGRLTCIVSVKPSVCIPKGGGISIVINNSLQNAYNTLHGGAVGSIAERVAIACARTVVSKDKELFLGELSISYLAAAVKNAEVIIDASVVRSGRNLTVVAMEFKLKESERLTCMSRATFYNMPVASL